jgi:hypothetical protein
LKIAAAVASLASALGATVALTSCGLSQSARVGETRKIALASDYRPTVDWPCFADKDEYEIWLETAGDHDKESTIEQNAMWLEPDDKVQILEAGDDPDSIRVRILESPSSDELGKTCWTMQYEGSMFK